jgi:hypothetical protein
MLGCCIISLHKFRHGNAVYSLQQAKDIAQLKAASQNLMHSNLSITDGVYGIMSNTDVKRQIANLGNNPGLPEGDLIAQLEGFLASYRQKSLR